MKRTPLHLAVAVVLGLAACTSPDTGASQGTELRGQRIEVAGIWSGDEQKQFERVLAVFAQRTGATVHYTSYGDNVPTLVQAKVAGRNPPNIAFFAQPGTITSFAREGALKPLPADVVNEVRLHQAPAWLDFASVDGIPYGVYFDANNKSVIWYNSAQFDLVGGQPPETWARFLDLADELADAGITPMSVGAADGWVLTDWFEQVYLQTAGLDNYNKLGRHEIPWTDPTVTTALRLLQQFFGQDALISGGRTGALQTGFPASVVNTFQRNPKAAMVYEGNFVSTTISASTNAVIGVGAKAFPFPRIGASSAGVETGGDAAVAFTDDPATMALMRFLATPEAGAVLVSSAGFLSPNKDIPLESYPNDIARTMARQLLDAGNKIVFDSSDQAPPAFGATTGAGEWRDLQEFFANPADLDGTQRKLEADAAKSYPAG